MVIHLLLLSVVSALVAVLAYRWFSRIALQKKMTTRVHRAMTGEKNARDNLLRQGFRIEGEQVTKQCEILVNGAKRQFTIRADFIVSRNGRSAVVDAKSGEKAADPCNPDTRRRMFEYFYCYDVQDVYIYDDVCKKLLKIDFVKPAEVTRVKLAVHYCIAGIVTLFFAALIVLLIVRMA